MDCHYIHGLQRMNPINYGYPFGDFPSSTTTRLTFVVLNEISEQFGSKIPVPLKVILMK